MDFDQHLTLIDKQTGNLSFRIHFFKDNSLFDHMQRLNYYSIIWIKKGIGKVKVDFSEYNYQANNVFSLTPYQPFMLDTNELVEGVVLNFHPDFFCIHRHHAEIACNGVLFNTIYNPPLLKLEGDAINDFEMLITKMQFEMQNESLAQYEILISYLKIFLITASRLKTEQQEIVNEHSELEGHKSFILQDLKDHIEKNFRAKHAPAEYAQLLNITPKALSKLTKEHFDKTLTELISERIIIEAKRELYLTSKTIKEIAYELGYEDEHYFSRFFKNKVSISPKIYRETVGFAKAEN